MEIAKLGGGVDRDTPRLADGEEEGTVSEGKREERKEIYFHAGKGFLIVWGKKGTTICLRFGEGRELFSLSEEEKKSISLPS